MGSRVTSGCIHAYVLMISLGMLSLHGCSLPRRHDPRAARARLHPGETVPGIACQGLGAARAGG